IFDIFGPLGHSYIASGSSGFTVFTLLSSAVDGIGIEEHVRGPSLFCLFSLSGGKK
ncbi:Hypothetical protein FKW44_007027, partial [Caligus rogercresseyi]